MRHGFIAHAAATLNHRRRWPSLDKVSELECGKSKFHDSFPFYLPLYFFDRYIEIVSEIGRRVVPAHKKKFPITFVS